MIEWTKRSKTMKKLNRLVGFIIHHSILDINIIANKKSFLTLK